MSFNTVNSVGQLSSKSTETGGLPAAHSLENLQSAYPGSPIFKGTYSVSTVTSLKASMLTNSVRPGDLSDSQAYYGYPSTQTSDENEPQSADLSYAGAPNITENTQPVAPEDHTLGSSFFPTLTPPTLDFDNQDLTALAATADAQEKKTSRPPFAGPGSSLSPSVSSSEIRHRLIPVLPEANGLLAPQSAQEI